MRLRSANAIALVLWAVLVAAGCSAPTDKPDETQDDVVQQPPGDEQPPGEEASAQQDSADQASAEPGSGDTKPSLPSAEETAGDDKPVDNGDEKVEFASGFKSDLADAVNDAASGDRKGAIGRLQGLVDEPNGGFLAAFNLGVLYENEGDYQKAARRYSQALNKNANFSPALLNLVRLYIRLGQGRDADKLARKYTNERPDNMNHRAVALQVSLHQGKYEAVIRTAKRILRRDEKNVEAMLAMAEANIQLDRTELAEAILDRARELRGERAEIYFKYAKIRSREERVSDAITLLQRAIKHRPNYPEAHNNLGVLYHKAGDYQSAVTEFGAAIGDYPDFKQAYLNLGNSLKGMRKFGKAKKAFEQALDIDANYADALFNLGVLFLDSDIEGVDKIAQLNKSIEYFGKYKRAAGSRIEKDDPAQKYVQEARKAIEVEKQRQEMMRQAQMQADDQDSAEGEATSAEGDTDTGNEQ